MSVGAATQSAGSTEPRPGRSATVVSLRVLTPFIRFFAGTLRVLGVANLQRKMWLRASVIAFVIAAVGHLWVEGAPTQGLSPFWSLKWWNVPIELNGWRALPALKNADVNAVAILPTGRVFIGGGHGFLAYSDEPTKEWTAFDFDERLGYFVKKGEIGSGSNAGASVTESQQTQDNATAQPSTSQNASIPNHTSWKRAGETATSSAGQPRQAQPTPPNKATPQLGNEIAPGARTQNDTAATQPPNGSGPGTSGSAPTNAPSSSSQSPESNQQQSNPSGSAPSPNGGTQSPNASGSGSSRYTPTTNAPSRISQSRESNQQQSNPRDNTIQPPEQHQQAPPPQPELKKKGQVEWPWFTLIGTAYAAEKPKSEGGGSATTTQNAAGSALASEKRVQESMVPGNSPSPRTTATPDIVQLVAYSGEKGESSLTVIARDGRKWHSNDNGSTWNAAIPPRPAEIAGCALRVKELRTQFPPLFRNVRNDSELAEYRGELRIKVTDVGSIVPAPNAAAAATAAFVVCSGPAWVTTASANTHAEILYSNTVGTKWTGIAQSELPALYDVAFGRNSKTGYVVGAKGAVLRSDDNGLTWTPITQGAVEPNELRSTPIFHSYWKLPAPWTLLLGIVALACLGCVAVIDTVPGAKTVADAGEIVLDPDWKPERDGVTAVANFTVSDRPLEPEDLDVMGFARVARGISGFLRNPRTVLPVTIAINGIWGVGKSSMMNLVQRDLSAHGFRPLCFNAWHHQEDENLLASFLQAVKEDAAPSLFSMPGVLFRIRLGWQRFDRYYPRALSMLAIAAVLGGAEFYFDNASGGVDNLKRGIASVRIRMERIAKSVAPESSSKSTTRPPNQHPAVDHNKQEDKKQEDTQSSKTLIGIILILIFNLYSVLDLLARPAELIVGHGAAPPLVTLYTVFRIFPSAVKRLHAFTANPATLLESSSPGKSTKQLEAQTSFRLRFAREFRDVTNALGNRHRLVIFIDDLDRCRPAKVAEMLEAVNYIVVSGDCAVILGLETRAVKSSIGLSFRDVAEELEVPDPRAANLMEASEDKRKKFSERYIEKLINIEINIPAPSEGQKEELLQRARANAQRDIEMKRARQVSALTKWVREAALLVFVLGFCWGLGMSLVQGGEWRARKHYEQEAQVAQAPGTNRSVIENSATTAPSAQATNPKPVSPPESGALPVIENGELAQPAAFFRGWRGWAMFAWIALVFVTLLGRVPAPLSEDSALFATALRYWGPVAGAKTITPRSVKRFLNRVRCMAMLQHPPKAQTSFLVRWLTKKGSTVPEPLPPETLDEDVLVALAAVETYDRELLVDDLHLAGFLRSAELQKLANFRAKSSSWQQAVDEHTISRLLDARARYLEIRQ